MINSVTVIGNLGRDPETKFLTSGAQVTKFSVCVNEKYKDEDGNLKERPTWVPIETWGKSAAFAVDYLRKGFKVAVQGKLNSDTWQDGEGKNRSRLYVKADRIDNLTPKSKSEPQGSEYDEEF